MDLQHLLSEAPELPPCGPDLEYDPAFLALESAAQGKPEQGIAGTLIPAVEPNWPEVLDRAAGLLARSKDLRIAMLLLRALTRTAHLGGFVAGVELINGLLERWWADLHPRLDADDNNDPTLRLNALAAIEAPKGSGSDETLLKDLREAAVFPPTPQARVLVRDILIADGKLASASAGLGGAAIDAALRDAVAKDASLADLGSRGVAAVQRLRSLVTEQVGAELAPDVGVVLDMLKPVAHRLGQLSGRPAHSAAEAEPSADAGPRLSSDIRGREDVMRAIDAICAYLERTEPANPAPLLLRRAQRLLNKSFVDLIADLAPDGVAQVKLIAGLKDE